MIMWKHKNQLVRHCLHCSNQLQPTLLQLPHRSTHPSITHNLVHYSKSVRLFSVVSNNNTKYTAHTNQYRTHYCHQLNSGLVGGTVTVSGYIQHHRMLNNELYFGVLYDNTDTIQLKWSATNDQGKDIILRQQLRSLTNGSSISVRGIIQLRPPTQQRINQSTGTIELSIQYIYIANIANELPLKLQDTAFNIHNDELRLQYRYLDLRRPSMKCILQLRHTIIAQIRDYMNKLDYIDGRRRSR